MDKDEVVYSINIEDLQAVGKVAYGVELSEDQLKLLADKIGDYFADWFDTIEMAIEDVLELEKLDEPDWDEMPY